jgi:hypothetical protein
MAWTGHISDTETARKAGGSAIMADINLALGTSNITTVAVAEAAATAAVNNLAVTQICDRVIGQQCARGFRIASNMGGTFGSTFAVLEASLPSSAGHIRQMITG